MMEWGRTTREEIEVAVADEARLILGVLLPDGEHLHLCRTTFVNRWRLNETRNPHQGAKSRP